MLEVLPIAAPLSLSALSLDLIVALSQRPDGVGSSELARLVDGPSTSVQNNLRVLLAHGVVGRAGARYVLRADHPAAPELIAVGLRLPAPEAAIRVVLRANEAVEFACVDDGGFVVGTDTDPAPASVRELEDALATIRRDRPSPPHVLQFEMGDLARIMRSAIGLRTRVGAAEIVKGRVRRLGPVAESGYPDSHA